MTNVVFFIVDEKYFPIAYALARRIRHLSDEALDVYIFYESTTARVDVPSHPGITIVENTLMPRLPDDLPQSSLWPPIVWARLVAPKVLREGGYGGALYLDADIAVLGDLRFVFRFLPAECPLAAVQDTGTLGTMFPGKKKITVKERLKAIGVRGENYFNSGILLINLNIFTDIDLFAQLNSYKDINRSNMDLPDQDFLNYYFQKSWEFLSPRFNFQFTLLEMGLEKYFNPLIIHYNTIIKPWRGDIFDYTPAHRQYFINLFDSLDPNIVEAGKALLRPRRTRYVRALKTRWRELRHERGHTPEKIRRRAQAWETGRAKKFEFLRNALRQERFCDISADEAIRLIHALDALEKEPARYRNGRFSCGQDYWPDPSMKP